METFSRDLRFRSASRHDVALDATLTLRAPDNEQVRFSRSAVALDGSWHATVVDVSEGGLGAICELYVPTWARVHVHIPWPGQPERPLFDMDCMARRIQMIDRRPAYLIGLQFDDSSESAHQSLEEFMTLIEEGGSA